jgi:hypothetical protein
VDAACQAGALGEDMNRVFRPLPFLLALAGLPASAQENSIPRSGLSFEPYGQFNFAYQAFDDGRDRTENLVDPSTNKSRVGFFIRRKETDDGLSFHFETSLGFRASDKTSQLVTPDFWDLQLTDLRKFQLIYQGDIGTFKLGQGSMALDGAAELDLGGYNVVAKSNISEGYGDYIFRRSDGMLSSVTIGDAFDNFDGGRQFRASYATRRFAGLSVSAAYGTEVLEDGNDDEFFDVALRYENETADYRVEAAIGPGWENTSDGTENVVVGSFSILDPRTGLNATLAAGKSYDGTRPEYAYLKLGWNRRFFSSGDTRLVAEFFDGRNHVTRGADSDMWGVGVLQDFDRADLTVYAGFRSFDYADETTVSYLRAEGVQAGMVWKF